MKTEKIKIKNTLLTSLKLAGQILKGSLNERRIVQKKTELSLVTATDHAAEKVILKTLQKKFPDHAILTEESPPSGSSNCRWIIDPLDGTTNFAHTYPVSCVSIGFEKDHEIQMGGVYDPFRDELFFAERGQGAALNGKPIHVSKNAFLKDSLLCTGFPYDRRENLDKYLKIVKDFLMTIHDIRRSGSAALDLCYVAAGRFDGYWEFNLQAWDKAAGMLMVQEAGGQVSDFSGKSLTLESPENLASNGLIHPEMLAVFKSFERKIEGEDTEPLASQS